MVIVAAFFLNVSNPGPVFRENLEEPFSDAEVAAMEK